MWVRRWGGVHGVYSARALARAFARAVCACACGVCVRVPCVRARAVCVRVRCMRARAVCACVSVRACLTFLQSEVRYEVRRLQHLVRQRACFVTFVEPACMLDRSYECPSAVTTGSGRLDSRICRPRRTRLDSRICRARGRHGLLADWTDPVVTADRVSPDRQLLPNLQNPRSPWALDRLDSRTRDCMNNWNRNSSRRPRLLARGDSWEV